MMHSEVNKTGLIVSLLLLIYPIVVHGILYSNGLSSSGTNVCQERRDRSVATSTLVSTVSYQSYTTSCGFLGWGRCRRSRTVTGYKWKTIYRRTTDVYLRCCSGWRRSGNRCPIAICRYGCNNGGNCYYPNRCSCTSYWTGSTCSIDVNECSSNNGGCQQRCNNRRGTSRTCSCYSGYKTSPYNGKKCVDVDECRGSYACTCASGSNSCRQLCRNTVGSYYCLCGKGYRLQRSTVCTDINECAANNGGCSHQCVNSPGHYNCNCRRGFRLVNSKSCRDVNECASNNGNCQQNCRNLFGSHRCSCDEGFNLDNNGRTCSDIDECKTGHDCQKICNNALGGYTCSCNKGYQLTADNRTCADIDECASSKITGSKETATLSGCHHICTNFGGSFQCSCKNGYVLMYDKRQCKDIDECLTGNHSCDHNCLNSEGSYFCSCRPGYKLSSDGKKCEAQPCEKIDIPLNGIINCSGLVTDASCSFSCDPGFDLVGSKSRTCLPSSRWSGILTFCKAKYCEKLTTLKSQTILVPCFTSFGSTCFFGCRRGFFMDGDRQANCSLSSKGGVVSWRIGKFTCKEIKTCQPNPCRHGGKCFALNEKEYTCNCAGTGYKGDHCEIGYTITPIFPKLRSKTKSGRLFLFARPLRRLKVEMSSEKGVTFEPQSMVFDPSRTMEQFTVVAEKPGIRAITYDLEGESRNDFESPEPSVFFAAPETFSNNSLRRQLFLPKGELPIGCEEYNTKLSCDVRLSSTAQWTKISSSTNGIVHINSPKNRHIPLSLIGLDLGDRVSRDKMIEAGIARTSSFKEYTLLLPGNGTCQARLTDTNSLLELIQNDAFVSSFMEALSWTAPEWLSFSVAEKNNIFDIQNIAANLASDLEHCSGFLSNQASSLAYYRPTVNYKMRVAQNEVALLADGSTCFAINICKPGLFVNFPKGQADLIMSSLNLLRDMQNSGLSLHVRSIGLHRTKETAHFVKGIIWNGKELQELSSFHYHMWLKGSLDWKMEIPKTLFLSFRINGDAIIRSGDIDSLFTTFMSQRMDIQLRGEVILNVTGTALKNNFTLKLSSTKAIGKALLGGKAYCSKNIRGISLTLDKSTNNLFDKSPLGTYIRPKETEPVRLAMLMSISGGMRNKIDNIDEVKQFLYDIFSLLPDLQRVFVKAIEITSEGKTTLKKSLDMIHKLNASIGELKEMLTKNMLNITRALTLLDRIKYELKYCVSITYVLKDQRPLSSDKGTFGELLHRIDRIHANVPKELRPNLSGKPVDRTFHGISFYFRGNLCMRKLCFKDFSTTVDYLSENSCVSNTPKASMFRGKGKALKQIALSKEDILTLPIGHVIEFIFPRDSYAVSAHFVGRSNLLAVSQHVKVSLNKDQLSFKMEGKIFDRYMANMNVVAMIGHVAEWSSLVFTITGRMTNSSQLSERLQSQVTTFANFLAERAYKQVEMSKKSILIAEERLQTAKELVKKKKSIFDGALLEKRRKLSKFQRISSAYGKASTELESSLDQFLKVNNRKMCQFLSCNFIDSNTYIPGVCQKPVLVNYTVPVCRKVKETLEEEVVVSKVVVETKMVQTYVVEQRGDCGKTGKFLTGIGEGMTVAGGLASYLSPKLGGILTVAGVVTNVVGQLADLITGCDDYKVKVPGPKVQVEYNVRKNFREYRTKEIESFICDAQKMKTVISGYLPYECPKSGRIKVLDPTCVSQNTNCSLDMENLAAEIEFENETMFGDFQNMLATGKRATRAQLESNKAEIKFDSALRQLGLARARLQQREFARKAINLNTVKQREELGLKLGKSMEKLSNNTLIYVESLAFSVAMSSSSMKTRFPLTVYIRTFEGSHKAIQFSMDFNNEDGSLALASKRIVEAFVETSNSRRGRSLKEAPIISKRNDNEFSTERHECHLSKEANILFSDIVESMDFSIKSKREVEKALFSGSRSIEELSGKIENNGYFSYSDIILSLKDAQLNSSGAISWDDILHDARGSLDVVTQRKNFTQCSGILDCSNFFFDSLDEMYGVENHLRAIEIKEALQTLNKIIGSILRENITMSLLEEKLSQARFFINRSNDETILCGQKPTIKKNSPVKVVALLGGDIDLLCEAKSTLGVEYMWMKNGQPLEGENGTLLELRNVTEHSEGAYKCHASNTRGSTVSNVTILVVHQRPRVTEHPLDKQQLVGDETVWMVCNSTGVPKPSTEWFFIPMKGTRQNAVHLNVTGPVLKMGNLTTENAGFYYCNVSNLHGVAQSRIARLDVLRFIPGVPRIAVIFKLKQCVPIPSSGDSSSHSCHGRQIEKSQRNDTVTHQHIIQKILKHMSWPVEKIHDVHYAPFPDAVISFVLHGDDPITPEGKKFEALNEFSLSRRRIGNSMKKLYSSLADEKVKIRRGNLTIVGDKESLVMGFPSQKCPNGTRLHEYGYLCVYCPPGYYEVGNRTCEPCPVGTYQPDEGSTECVKCPYRVSSTEPGAVRESQCIDISIPCTKPPQAEVARSQLPNNIKTLHRSGETFNFKCQPGYKVAGNATTECNEGNWTKADFYCEKTCYPPWMELKRRCYLVVEAQAHRWVNARSQCLKLNTQMVIISSEEENEFVKQLAQVYLREKRWTRAQMWLGLRKMHAIDNFLWVDGSPLKGYTNWTPGEPNNARGQELCTEMLVSGKYRLGMWNDLKCHAARHKPITVCEKPLQKGE